MYSDDDVAAPYDRLNPWGPSDDFYLSCVLAAPSALDVGCAGPGSGPTSSGSRAGPRT